MKLLLILITITLLSCSSLRSNMDSWVGRHRTEMYRYWGKPTTESRYDMRYEQQYGSMVRTYCLIVDENGVIKGWIVVEPWGVKTIKTKIF